MAFATDGIRVLRSPAAKSPGTLVRNIGSTSTASTMGPGPAGAAPSCSASEERLR
ncbi:MAG: hypothetical protein QOK40_3253 [Miltoncostaeaceae bacterium]|jgi:hypothetical protein|nr:hypothetical protein [Miltoncostaeaceae bacterium]